MLVGVHSIYILYDPCFPFLYSSFGKLYESRERADWFIFLASIPVPGFSIHEIGVSKQAHYVGMERGFHWSMFYAEMYTRLRLIKYTIATVM